MNIKITTFHPYLPFMLQQSAPTGVTVSFHPIVERRDTTQTLHEIFIYCADIGKDVGVGLFSAWLYDRIVKHKAESVEIDGNEIPIAQADIQRAIEESPREPRP